MQGWKTQVRKREKRMDVFKEQIRLLITDASCIIVCDAKYVFVLAFSVVAFSIIMKCVLLYLHFPYLCFPVLAISAPPTMSRMSEEGLPCIASSYRKWREYMQKLLNEETV